jgi:tripartite-type tricarboxylate transporter receptor subunit TctC
VTAKTRLRELPDVPPIADTLPSYEVLSWAGLMLPVKASKQLVATVHKAAVSTLAKPDVAKRLEELGFIVVGSRGDEMEAYVRTEIDKYAKLIQQVGMPLQ